MNITFVQRRRFHEQYSVESYFDRVAASLRQRGVSVDQFIAPQYSKGLVPRIRNTLAMRSLPKADLYHITGDIHYVALGCPPEKTILTVHDCGTLDRLKGIRHQIFKLFWYTWPTQRVAAISVVSQKTKQVLLEYVPSLCPEKVHVIPTTVSERYEYVPKVFQDEKPRILQVGTRANKNVLRTIAALKGIPCKLALIGSLSESQLTALRENQIDFENYVGLTNEQIVEQYHLADIVSFPSTLEGFGMPVVEAQVTGRPVVTSNISSMPEVAGDGAVLVDPFSVDSIREGFIEVISNSQLRNELIEKGRINSQRFTQDKITNQYLDLYQSLRS